MNPAPFTDRFLAVVANQWSELEFCIQELGESKTRTIREDTGNSAHRRRCASCLTTRSSSRTAYALSALKNLRTTTMSCPIIKIRKAWAERGETITQTTCRQRIGGAIRKKDQPEWRTERPISRHCTISRFSRNPGGEKCARLARSRAVLVGEVRTYLGRRSSTCQPEFCWQTPGGVSQNVPFFSGRYAPEWFCSVPLPSAVIRKKRSTNHCLAQRAAAVH